MPKYINADILNAKVYELYDPSDNDDIHRGIGTVQDLINEMPAADVVEVVRCKDCKHSKYREDYDDYECEASGCGLVNNADFYCADGERKETE